MTTGVEPGSAQLTPEEIPRRRGRRRRRAGVPPHNAQATDGIAACVEAGSARSARDLPHEAIAAKMVKAGIALVATLIAPERIGHTARRQRGGPEFAVRKSEAVIAPPSRKFPAGMHHGVRSPRAPTPNALQPHGRSFRAALMVKAGMSPLERSAGDVHGAASRPSRGDGTDRAGTRRRPHRVAGDLGRSGSRRSMPCGSDAKGRIAVTGSRAPLSRVLKPSGRPRGWRDTRSACGRGLIQRAAAVVLLPPCGSPRDRSGAASGGAARLVSSMPSWRAGGAPRLRPAGALASRPLRPGAHRVGPGSGHSWWRWV